MDAWVSGEVVFAARPVLPPEAILRVRLLDTTYADAPSRILDEVTFADIAGTANSGSPLCFQMRAQLSDWRIRCTVWAHVALAPHEGVECGDYVTTQSYPVLTQGYPDHVSLQLHRVQ